VALRYQAGVSGAAGVDAGRWWAGGGWLWRSSRLVQLAAPRTGGGADGGPSTAKVNTNPAEGKLLARVAVEWQHWSDLSLRSG